MTEEEKKDEEALQQEGEQETSFVTILFESPGSARVAGLRTQGVSLNQLVLAARELQNIVDFEQWWGFYHSRMAAMEEKAARQAEEEMLRRMLAQGGVIKPN